MNGAASERGTPRFLVGGAFLLAGGVFLADLRLPLGASVSAFYVAVVLLGLWAPSRRFTAATAASVSALTALGAVLSPGGPSPWMAAVNRPAALMLIWVTALGVMRYKTAEKRFLEERRQAQAYLDIAAVPIVALDAADRVVLLNPRGCDLVGREKAELIGRPWIDMCVPDTERGRARDVLAGLRAGRLPPGQPYDLRVLTAGGEERLVEWRGTVTRDAAGRVNGTLSSGEDTTDKKRAEALLAHVVESAPLTLLAIDVSGVLTLAEGTGLRRMGIGPPRLVGAPGAEALAHLPWLAEPLQRALTGEPSTTAGALHEATYEVRATPLRAASGDIVGALAVSLDVSERVRADAALRRQQTLAELGGLAAMVAHEVRNPLAGIRATIQVLAKRLPASDQDTVKALFVRIDALNEMTNDLLSFARPRPLQPAELPLKPLLGEAATFLARDGRWPKVAVDVSGDEASAWADALALRGVFLNLLLNAAEAMGGTGTIRARVAAAGPKCRVFVEDSGPGIPAEVRARIFEPFFTTRHRGTGLGLAIVRRQVELHGGEVSVACPPAGGTIVTVELPRHAPPA
jgi:PAS domain S-box-containing protein